MTQQCGRVPAVSSTGAAAGGTRVLIAGDDFAECPSGQDLARAAIRALTDFGATPVWWEIGADITARGMDPDWCARLRHEAGRAHAIVLISATKHDSYSGALKLALEQLDTGQLRRKPVGLMSASDSATSRATEHLRAVMESLHAFVIPHQVTLLVTAHRPPSVNKALANEVRRLVNDLLWLIRRFEQHPARPASAPSAAPEPPVPDERISPGIRSAITHIHENFANGTLTLDSAARAACLSRYHFSRTFKDQTGRRFVEYLTKLRLDRAMRLLSETQRPISEISQHIGYRELSHFQRTFKKWVGVSPSEYRITRRAASSTSSRKQR